MNKCMIVPGYCLTLFKNMCDDRVLLSSMNLTLFIAFSKTILILYLNATLSMCDKNVRSPDLAIAEKGKKALFLLKNFLESLKPC